MAVPLALNQVLELRLYSVLGDQLGMNVGHYRVTQVSGTSITDADVAAELVDTFPDLLKGVMSADATYQGLEVQIIDPIRYSAAANIANAGPGTLSGSPLPRQTCGLVSLRTELARRGGNGRKYTPFPAASAADADTGEPTVAFLAALTAYGGAWTLAIAITDGESTVTADPVLWSAKTRTTAKVIGSVARQGWATQRRRSDYGRPNVSPI